MVPYKLNITRWLIAGLVAGPLAFAVPWVLLCLLLIAKRLGSDIYPDINGACLGSLFLASILGTAAFVAFGTCTRNPVRNDFAAVTFAVAFVASAIPALLGLAHGPRVKSEPDFGQSPIDFVLLTAPAVATGIVILVWRGLLASRYDALEIRKPTAKQP